MTWTVAWVVPDHAARRTRPRKDRQRSPGQTPFQPSAAAARANLRGYAAKTRLQRNQQHRHLAAADHRRRRRTDDEVADAAMAVGARDQEVEALLGDLAIERCLGLTGHEARRDRAPRRPKPIGRLLHLRRHRGTLLARVQERDLEAGKDRTRRHLGEGRPALGLASQATSTFAIGRKARAATRTGTVAARTTRSRFDPRCPEAKSAASPRLPMTMARSPGSRPRPPHRGDRPVAAAP